MQKQIKPLALELSQRLFILLQEGAFLSETGGNKQTIGYGLKTLFSGYIDFQLS